MRKKLLVNCKQCSKMSFTHLKTTNRLNENFENYSKSWHTIVSCKNIPVYTIHYIQWILARKKGIHICSAAIGFILIKELIQAEIELNCCKCQRHHSTTNKATHFRWVCKKYGKISFIFHRNRSLAHLNNSLSAERILKSIHQSNMDDGTVWWKRALTSLSIRTMWTVLLPFSCIEIF